MLYIFSLYLRTHGMVEYSTVHFYPNNQPNMLKTLKVALNLLNLYLTIFFFNERQNVW